MKRYLRAGLLCALAAGRIDGFITDRADGLELAGGELLVHEAGGVTVTLTS